MSKIKVVMLTVNWREEHQKLKWEFIFCISSLNAYLDFKNSYYSMLGPLIRFIIPYDLCEEKLLEYPKQGQKKS